MKTSKSIIERKMSVYWLTLLLFNGTNVYPGHKYSGMVKTFATIFPWIICLFWAFITLSVTTSLIVRDTGYEDKLEMLALMTGSSNTLAMYAFGIYKKPEFNRMLNLIQHEFWHDERRPAADVLYSRFVRTYGAIMPVANVIMCITPVIWVTNSDGNVNSPSAQIFYMWSPWTYLSPSKYTIVYTIQFVISLSVLISITGMVFSLVLIVNEMQVQVDMLIDMVNDIDLDNYSTSNDHRNVVVTIVPNSTQVVYGSLIKCVKHHQMLIAYFNNFKSYFNLLFIVDIVYILIMTCLSAISVLVKGISAIHIKMMSLLIVVISQFFFYCLIGEKFSLMNKQFGDQVYFKLVKCKDPKLLKTGVLIILRTQRPLQLTAMGIVKYSASLFTFTVTMRSAYAGLNVLYKSLQNTNK